MATKVPKWILIGDHQQLPAVVVQPAKTVRSWITIWKAWKYAIQRFPCLSGFIGEQPIRMGLGLCSIATTRPDAQGDHGFSKRLFYQNTLELLDINLSSPKTHRTHSMERLALADPLIDALSTHRMIFIPALVDLGRPPKTNRYEESRPLVCPGLQGCLSTPRTLGR